MRYGSIILGFLIIVGIFIYTPKFIYAETKVVSGDINIEMIPNNPEPYTDVTVKLASYATDLNRASIDWKINNQTVLSGIGRTSYTFKTGGPNSATVINLNILPDNGIIITRQIAVVPSEIEMLWQAVDSYTPSFYKGKALPTQQSVIKVVAFPNTVNIEKANKKNMIYTWKLNDSAAQNASGYGKDSFTFENNVLKNTEHVELSASMINNLYNATGTLDINIENPKLLFYQKSPINGVLYDEALQGSTTMAEDEMTIVAEPYYMNRNSNDLAYNWKINNEQIETPSRRTELTIRPASRGGYATIALTVESITKLFQSVTNSIKINL
ncbi:hypothetical protein IT400_01195 [Candidatus Nomurabacteria bacterium]|nr:hypothetical protein [Candidatus Nomurabacteria bacterium]